MSEDVCRDCSWKPFGGSCLVWKYLSPEICKQIKEEIDKIPIRGYQSPPLESVNVVRVLCGFDYSVDPEIEPTGTYYKYSKVKSVMRVKEWITISSIQITKEEYEAFIKEEEENKNKVTLSQFTPPSNPWR